MLRKYGEKLIRAHRRAIGGAVGSDPPVPSPLNDLRALAAVLPMLAVDSPEVRTLLERCQLPPDALSAHRCQSLSESILQVLDSDEANAAWDSPYSKLPEGFRDEKPPVDGLNTQRLSDVNPRPVAWQREGFTALGKLTLL